MEPALLIGGRVEAPGGPPAGARIDLRPAVVDHEEARRQLTAGAAAPQPEPLATARPAPDGSFTLQAPGPGCYRVVVSAPGYLAVERLLPLPADRIDRRQVVLPPVRLVGTSPAALAAVGPKGEPLAGVLVELRGHRGIIAPSPPPEWQPTERTGVTDAGGRLELQLGAEDEVVSVTALDPRFFGQRQQLDGAALRIRQNGAPRAAILNLAARPAVAVAVLDAGGAPVAEALLRTPSGRAIGITGRDGRLGIALAGRDAAAGIDPLTIESPAGEQAAAVAWVEVRGGSLRVQLAPLRTMTGQLIDASSGAGIASGLVWAEGGEVWDGTAARIPPIVEAAAVAAADGRFTLRLPPGAGLRVKAGAAGYLTASPPVHAPAGAPWQVRLERAADLAGQVVDAAGRGVAGARVKAHDTDDRLDNPLPATTDAAGRFLLHAAGPGRRYQLDVTAADFMPASVLARVPTSPPPPEPPGQGPGREAAAGRPPAAMVRIVLDPGRTAAGTVVDREGRPLPDMAVVLVPAGAAATGAPSLDLRLWSGPSPGEGVWRSRSDARGGFTLRHLPPGRYRLLAGGPGFVAAERQDVEILPAARRLDLGRIVLDPGAAITGVVTDRRGAPLARVQITFKPLAGGSVPGDAGQTGFILGGLGAGSDAVATGPDGRFVIGDVRAGERFELLVEHPEHLPMRLADVRAPTAEPLHIELAGGGRLAGRVTDTAGEPVFGAMVTVRSQLRPTFAPRLGAAVSRLVETGADGGFSAAGLAEGPCDVTAEAEGYRAAHQYSVSAVGSKPTGIEIQAGDNELDLVLDEKKESAVSGRIADTVGAPVAGAALWLDPMPNDQGYRQATSLSDGSFVFSRVALGRYRLTARARGFAPLADPPVIELSEAPAEGLALTLEPVSAAVSGHLLGLAPEELAQARVVAAPAGSSFTDASGASASSDPSASSAAGGQDDWALSVRDPFRRTTATVDEGGAYQIAGLAPGAWTVTATAGAGRTASGGVALSAEAPVATLDLDFAGSLALAGGLAVDGQPVAGAVLHLIRTDAPQESIELATAADGTFRFSSLHPGSYGLAAIDFRRLIAASVPVELTAGQAVQEVTLEIATGTLRSRVVTAAGDPVAGATVKPEASDPARGVPVMAEATTDASGAFEMPGLPVNTYLVKASAPGLSAAQVSATVEAGAAGAGDGAVVEIVLTPPGER